MIAISPINFTEITLDSRKPELLFSQLARELKRLIMTGGCHAGFPLPSARKLAELLDINRVTVHKSYELLLKEQIIEHASPRCYRVSETLRRRELTPFSTIGVVLPCCFSYFLKANEQVALQYISGIIDAAAEKSISTIMLSLPDVNAAQETIDAYLAELEKRLVGIVHIGDRLNLNDPPLEALMKNQNIPQVMVAAITNLPNVGCVLCDSTSGAKALAEQIITLGHHRIGLIACKKKDGLKIFSYASYRRPQEIQQVLSDYGLDCQPQYRLECQENQDSILQQLTLLKTDGQLPTLFICQNDDMALWTISALQKLGMKVPDDISVVGYDGTSNALDAGLTTICQPFYAIGRQAVLSLLDYSDRGIGTQNRTRRVQSYLLSRSTLASARIKS